MADELFGLMLGSIPAMALVYLIVEGLKRFGFVQDKSWFTAPRSALITALVLTGVGLVSAFVPEAAQYINAAAPILFGGLIAGLFYDIVGDMLLERVQAVVAAILGK